MIVTNKHVYSIDVHLVSGDKKATYQLLYRYPAEAAMIAENRARQKAIDNELNKDDPNLLEERPLGNYQYTMNFGKDKGSEALAPTLVFDDNNFTYFKFQSQRDFPAIYRVTPDGESMVNYHVEKGVLIVHGVFYVFSYYTSLHFTPSNYLEVSLPEFHFGTGIFVSRPSLDTQILVYCCR